MSRLASRLLKWYAANGRRLPWRGTRDPYRVWVSEIMLQQTRVEAVIPYYRRWLRRFPTLRALASASERDVLRLWEGLGYYARARNLHNAAKVVLSKYLGQLPSGLQDLLRLPGIGPYTAGAISSIAFGQNETVLDGNVRRVLARLFAVRAAADSPAGLAALGKLAAVHLPDGRAGDFNQALMDLGATVCVPIKPRCRLCPLARLCEAYRLGRQDQFPVTAPSKRIPHRVLGAVATSRDGRILIARRPSKGLLGGLWEFPNVEMDSSARVLPAAPFALQFRKALLQGYGLRLTRGVPLATIRHAYSHYRVIVHIFRCKTRSKTSGRDLRWICPKDLRRYPMGKVDRQIADMIEA